LHLGDTSREITGEFEVFGYRDYGATGVFGITRFIYKTIDVFPGDSWGDTYFNFAASKFVPVSHEFRPTSISTLACISY
jgi:hypothetical protein